MIKLHSVLALIISVFASVAHAGDSCAKGVLKADMCAEARKLSDGIAAMLPMRMSQNMSWESVAAFGTTVQAHVRLAYDKGYLEELSRKGGIPMAQVRDAIEKSALNVCQPNTATRSFVRRGGSLKYVYLFADGEQFTSAVVDSCN